MRTAGRTSSSWNALAAEAAGVSALPCMDGPGSKCRVWVMRTLRPFADKVAQAWLRFHLSANGDIRTVQDAKQRIEDGADASWLVALLWAILISSTKSITTLKQEKSCLIWLLKTRWRLTWTFESLDRSQRWAHCRSWIPRARPSLPPWYLRCSQILRRHSPS